MAKAPRTGGTRQPTAPRPLLAGQRRILRNPPRKPKQAVVVVHGMGEQRPLETLREFVEAVYQRDLSLTSTDPIVRPWVRDTDEYGREINRVWIVPDSATGSMDLRRISTRENINGKVTDFYEFYWADLVDGTPWEMVVAWFRGLLLRSPYRVPARPQVWIAWVLLWLLAAAFIVGGYWLGQADKDPIKSWAEGAGKWLADNGQWVGTPLVVAGVLWLAARWSLAVERTRFGWPAIFFAIGFAVLALKDTGLFSTGQFWAGLLMAASAYITGSLILPYVGDIVRFVRATPQTVEARAAVRERGLALLKEIHTKGLNAEGQGTREYDRVVVVAHSLGAIVAYDLLQRYWEEIGPNHRNTNSPNPQLEAALKDVNQFVEDQYHHRPFSLARYRAAQQKLHAELVKSGKGSWLISDFITLGSPIVHSEFLVADSQAQLDQFLNERMFSSSPPRSDLPNSSMLYWVGNKGPYAHHAAVFAATRWTNLYDDHWFPLFGDIVSGKVPDTFGPGIEEHPLRILRPGLLPRFVTHTEYWYNKDPTWTVTSDHIQILRDALRLA